MKRAKQVPFGLIITLIAMLFLTACVRPVPGAEPEESEDTTATPLPGAVATLAPTVQAPIAPTLPAADVSPTPESGAAEGTEGETTEPPPDTTAPESTTPEQAPETAAPEPTAQPAAPTDETRPATHTVQAGENLFRLGIRYGCSAQQLASFNNIPNVDRIYVGQVIQIPPAC